MDRLALILVIIGALNWGLIGLFGFDLVAAIFGTGSTLSRIIYPWWGWQACGVCPCCGGSAPRKLTVSADPKSLLLESEGLYSL